MISVLYPIKMRIFISIVTLISCLHLTNGLNITNSTLTSLPKDCKPTGDDLCVQKCAKDGFIYRQWMNGSHTIFAKTLTTIIYKVYESNDTHIRTDGFNANISIYRGVKPKNWISMDMDEVKGITLHNMSAILASGDEVVLVPLHQYCFDFLMGDDETNISLMFRVDPMLFDGIPVGMNTKEAALYFPFLTLSCMSFFISALFYLFVLNVDDRNNKKCFVGYTLSMGFSFLCLVLLQVNNNACNTLGAFFLLFTISGFVWFTFLCLDLFLDIKHFEEGYKSKTLWITYLGASIIIPVVVVMASSGRPGIPETFIKQYSSDAILCQFQNVNNATFFVPVGSALMFSLVCICLALHYIKINNCLHTNHFPWLDKRSKYKYMCISCILIWITLALWIVEAGISSAMHQDISNIAMDLIEALQGIFAILIFVSDRYTRKELSRKCRKDFKTKSTLEKELSSNFQEKSKAEETELTELPGHQKVNEASNLLSNNSQTQD